MFCPSDFGHSNSVPQQQCHPCALEQPVADTQQLLQNRTCIAQHSSLQSLVMRSAVHGHVDRLVLNVALRLREAACFLTSGRR